VLRNRFEPKSGEVKDTGENLVMSFVTLCSSPNGIQFIKPRRVSEPRHETCAGTAERHTACWREKPKERRNWKT
jgi:hypothetical protein